jgi:hypothetical protein
VQRRRADSLDGRDGAACFDGAAEGGEVVYVGMYGSANGGGTLAGHVLSATYNSASGTWSAWTDVTALNAVTNDTHTMNYFGYDISSLFIDPHDTTGQTVYVTVAGIQTRRKTCRWCIARRRRGALDIVDGQPAPRLRPTAWWWTRRTPTRFTSPPMPESIRRSRLELRQRASGCWSAFGSGLPEAPVVALSAAPATASVHESCGRHLRPRHLDQSPVGSRRGGSGPATDTLSVTALSFPSTIEWQLSSGANRDADQQRRVPLTSIAISVSGAFQQTNNCTASLAANSSCAISVQFYPAATGTQTGTLSITDATRTPETVALSGTGLAPPVLGVSPASLTFTAQTVGQASLAQTVTVSNSGGAPLANVGFQINGLSASSFSYGSTTCGATLANGSSCTVQVTFAPTTAGGATASLVVSSSTSGVAAATVPLTGTSQNPAGLNVSPAQLVFPIVAPGQSSTAQVTITNNGGSRR